MPFHPGRAFPGDNIPDAVRQVTGAQIRRLNRHFQPRILKVAGMIICPGHFQFLPQDSRDLPGDSQNTLAVRSVGCNRDVENILVQPHHRSDIRPGLGIFRQFQQAVYFRSGIQVLIQPQFISAAEHSLGRNPVQRFRLDGNPAGQLRSVQCGGGMHPCEYIRRAGHNLFCTQFSAVDLANEQMRAFDRFAGYDLPNHDAAHFRAQLCQFLNFKSASEELFLQFLSADIYIHILLQPAERCNHFSFPPYGLSP